MSSVFSVKMRKELKERMQKYRDRINWAEEVKRFIEERLKQLEAEENFREILNMLEDAKWSVPKGFAESTVRENRDSG